MIETNEKLQSLFTYLEEWRTNIKNFAVWAEKFGLGKYENDFKKQSNKFAGRMHDLISDIKEHGEEYDMTMIIVNVKTELKMLEFDRNKVFNMLTEICSNVAKMQDSGISESPPSETNNRNSIDDNEGERKKKPKVVLSDGSEYTGEWLNEEPDGNGVKVFPQTDSKSGVKLSTVRVKYEGQFKRGRAHGTGKWTFANGSSYEGMWENDEKHGQGKLISKKGNILTGKWINGTLEGKGKEVWPNGDIFEGDFSMGK